MEKSEKFLTTTEACKILQVSHMTISRLLKDRKLEHFIYGRAARIPLSALLRFKEKSRIKVLED